MGTTLTASEGLATVRTRSVELEASVGVRGHTLAPEDVPGSWIWLITAISSVRAGYRRGGYRYSTAGVRTRTDTCLSTGQGQAAALLTPVRPVGVTSAA